MNNIPEDQNSEPFLRLLRARSRVYEEAVRLQVTQLVVTVAIPVLLSITGLLAPQTRPYVALLAVVITIVDVAWLDRCQRAKLRTAAKISEEFDCTLLDIPWNSFTAGKRADPERVEAAVSGWHHGDDTLRNWYPPVVGRAPVYLARIVCQRTNLWYDSNLRRYWGSALVFVAAGTVAVLFFAGIVIDLSLADFVVTVLTPAAPVLIWAIRDCLRQRDAAEAQESAKNEADALWETIAAGECGEDQCAVRSREFQDAIYQRRASNPLVFPFLYRLLRSRMERRMNAGAEELLKAVGI